MKPALGPEATWLGDWGPVRLPDSTACSGTVLPTDTGTTSEATRQFSLSRWPQNPGTGNVPEAQLGLSMGQRTGQECWLGPCPTIPSGDTGGIGAADSCLVSGFPQACTSHPRMRLPSSCSAALLLQPPPPAGRARTRTRGHPGHAGLPGDWEHTSTANMNAHEKQLCHHPRAGVWGMGMVPTARQEAHL